MKQRLRRLVQKATGSPPDPSHASPEDVNKYVQKAVQSNPHHYTDTDDGPRDAGVPIPGTSREDFQKNSDARHKSEYPWLFDPSRGVRWDFDPIELRTLSQENAWVSMLVETIVKEIAGTPWTITESEGEGETAKRLKTQPGERTPVSKELPDETAEEIAALLRDPNPDDNWHDFIEKTVADLLEVGNATTVKAFPKSDYNDNDELAVEPDLTKPLDLMPSAPEVWTKDYREKTGILDGYWQFDRHNSPGGISGGQGARGVGHVIEFDRSEVMWAGIAKRSNMRYSAPPTLYVKDFLQAIDLAVTQEQAYLSRGSTPSGMLAFEENDTNQQNEFRQEMENLKGKPWKLMDVWGTDAEFIPFSYNFEEMQFTERQKWYSKVIASAFQVPTAVVGLEPEKVNYATFQGERENFENNTLGPYLQLVERWINDSLVEPHWGSGYRFEFQPGMSESTRQMISERVRNNVKAGLLSPNEARREIGRDAVDSEDAESLGTVDGADDGEEGPLAGLQASGGGSGNLNKADDEPLRSTQEWSAFDVQPGEVEALREEIAGPVSELFDAVLSDEEIQAEIERLATPEDAEKGVMGIAARIREKLDELDLGDRITDAIRDHTASEARESVEAALREAEDVEDVDADDLDVDVEAVEARLRDREVEFANSFANNVAEEIRETVGDGFADGKSSMEIAEDISEQANISEGWQGAERIARQELHVATSEAREEVAGELGKVEELLTSGDGRVREGHEALAGAWKRPGESWIVPYEDGTEEENPIGNSRKGIGCRCTSLLRDREDVDAGDYAGDGESPVEL